MRRPGPPKRSTIITWIVVLLLALAGAVAYVVIKLDVFAPSLSEQVSSIQKADGSWWLGTTFEGMPITMAEPAGGDRVNDIGYGACERFGSKLDPFASTRCGYPLILQVRKRRYDIALDELPEAARRQLRQDDDSRRSGRRRARVVPFSTRTTWRSPSSAGPSRSDGRSRRCGRSTARPDFKPPSPGVDALDNCIKVAHPFAPLAQRIAQLRTAAGPAARRGSASGMRAGA